MTELSVEVANLGKNFGPVRALHDVTFQVQAGSYFVLLGPSGGGKTTLLRLIGGFERPSRGTVRLMGQDVTRLPPNERGSSMVFQSYALFPHMNVERNVGYGLKLRRTAKEEIARQVGAMLELVGLGGLNRRMPNELSGGQQQRVQLARSLVLGTRILLLDEPLASLDAKLRKEMCLELKHIQERVGITFIHVTHNQEEAMTVANRIAIIADGRLVEEATPQDIYVNPQAAFTAEFIGENNLLPGRVVGIDGDDVVVDVGFGKVRVAARGQAISQNADVTVSIRSEKLNLLPKGAAADGMERLPGTLAERVFLGLTTNYLVRLAPERTALLRRTSEEAVAGTAEGGPVELTWNREDARLHTF